MTTDADDDRPAAGAIASAVPDVLRAGFEWLPIGVLLVTEDGAIVLLNRAIERLLGYSTPELIGQSLDAIVPDALQPRDPAEASAVYARRQDGSELPVEIRQSPLLMDGRRVVLVSMVDISERRRSESGLRQALDDRIAFEALIADLAAQFVNLRPEEVDRAIEEALGRLVRTLGLDRSALFQVVETTGDLIHTHQWTRPGRPSPPPRLSAREQFPWLLSRVLSGELVVYSAIDEVPDPIDREGFRQLGTRSSVVIPLVIRGQIWGALTFATVDDTRTWTPELVNRFRVLALMFSNVLARKQSDEGLRRAMAGQADQRARLRDENAYLRHELNAFVGAPAIVGNSAATRRVLEQVRQVAVSDAAVLLLGETGTGKSLLANRIHELSGRGGRAMVRFNCASLSAGSAETELYGREQGAYGHGETRHMGLLELGHGSTVFFDEVADLSLDLQASLARVLQTRQIQPRGSARPIEVDFRVVAASRHDLAARIEEGLFRDDLYYRLHVLSIQLPPLRDRIEDLPLLVWRFVDEFSAAYGKSIDTIDQESFEQLRRYDWPGNARELRNVVERAMIVSTGRRLRIALPSPVGRSEGEADTLAAVEKAHIAAILAAAGGKIEGRNGAAARLGITPRALNAKIIKLGIRRRRA